MKRCSKCRVDKPLDDFYRRDGKPLARCKECCRAQVAARRQAQIEQDPEGFLAHEAATKRRSNARHRERRRLEERQRYDPEKALAGRVRRLYGIDVDEYRAILARGCAICGSMESLHLDHDHSNGKVRDALCAGCNVGIGHFGEDPDRLRAAADYIERHQR